MIKQGNVNDLYLIKGGLQHTFLKHRGSTVECLEGTTAAGKTTVGAYKFIQMVSESDKKHHFIAGRSVGLVGRNIITSDMGLEKTYGDAIQYYPNGRGGNKSPHIVVYTGKDDDPEKIINIFGYDDSSSWKNALGGQFGCGMIDEVNIANIDMVVESKARVDYLITTSNPDDPTLPVYSELINRTRPHPASLRGTPKEILYELESAQPMDGWTHWFFSFDDNAYLKMNPKKLQQIKTSATPGTPFYQNKILGIRGISEGRVLESFDRRKNVISENKAKTLKFTEFSVGVDTSYSTRTDDSMIFLFMGLTDQNKLVILDEYVHNNAWTGQKKLYPSLVSKLLLKFLRENQKKWGFAYNTYIDSADSGTILEVQKTKKEEGALFNFKGADKKMQIMDRIQLMNGWINDGNYLVVDTCLEHLREIESYSFKNGKPEDRNDHTINASQYGWMAWKDKVGLKVRKSDKKIKRQKVIEMLGRF